MTEAVANASSRPVNPGVPVPDDGGNPLSFIWKLAGQGPYAVLAGYLIWQQSAIVSDFKQVHAEDIAQLQKMDERNYTLHIQQIELQKEIRDELRRVISVVPGTPKP